MYQCADCKKKLDEEKIKRSKNSFGAERNDFWFIFEGKKYWGVNIGDNQIARVKRVKS